MSGNERLERTLNSLFGPERLFGGPESGEPFVIAFNKAIDWFKKSDFRVTKIKFLESNDPEGIVY